jgi:hypothetical protein
MIYSILIYAIFILPISLYLYKKDGKKWLFFKIINSLITLYIFVLIAGNLKRLIIGLTDNSYLVMNEVPIGLNISISVLYSILSIFVGVQVIKTALRKECGRKLLVLLIPLLWIFTSIDKYYVYAKLYNENPSMSYAIFSNIIYALMWLGIFLIYNSKKVKLFFHAPLSNASCQHRI